MTEGAGAGFALLASFGGDTFEQPGSFIADIATLDASGSGKLEYIISPSALPLPEELWITFAAVYNNLGTVLTPQADLVPWPS